MPEHKENEKEKKGFQDSVPSEDADDGNKEHSQKSEKEDTCPDEQRDRREPQNPRRNIPRERVVRDEESDIENEIQSEVDGLFCFSRHRAPPDQ